MTAEIIAKALGALRARALPTAIDWSAVDDNALVEAVRAISVERALNAAAAVELTTTEGQAPRRAGANAGASFTGRNAMITLSSTDHRAAAKDGPVFVLRVRPEPGVDDPFRALRAVLKSMLRRHGLRCLSARQDNEGNDHAGPNTV
jgi:hypothetical protein